MMMKEESTMDGHTCDDPRWLLHLKLDEGMKVGRYLPLIMLKILVLYTFKYKLLKFPEFS